MIHLLHRNKAIQNPQQLSGVFMAPLLKGSDKRHTKIPALNCHLIALGCSHVGGAQKQIIKITACLQQKGNINFHLLFQNLGFNMPAL